MTDRDAATPQRTRPSVRSALVGGMVVLEVGPDRVKYCVHKALLEHHSEYFRTALKGPWTEAQEGVFRLEDVEPGAVNIFVHWLYMQQFPENCDRKEWKEIIGESEDPQILSKLKAYVFGDRFMSRDFRQAMNNQAVGHIDEEIVSNSEMRYLAEQAAKHIPSDWPIFQCPVDKHCQWWSSHSPETDTAAGLPHRFTVRAIKRLSLMLY